MLSLALHSMVLIAKKDKELLSVRDIAEATGFSVNHLAKVMQRLTQASLVKSVRGPKGGFALKRDAADITFLDIYEAVESKIKVNGCPVDKEKCPFNKCIFDDTISSINRQFSDFLQSRNLESFLDY